MSANTLFKKSPFVRKIPLDVGRRFLSQGLQAQIADVFEVEFLLLFDGMREETPERINGYDSWSEV